MEGAPSKGEAPPPYSPPGSTYNPYLPSHQIDNNLPQDTQHQPYIPGPYGHSQSEPYGGNQQYSQHNLSPTHGVQQSQVQGPYGVQQHQDCAPPQSNPISMPPSQYNSPSQSQSYNSQQHDYQQAVVPANTTPSLVVVQEPQKNIKPGAFAVSHPHCALPHPSHIPRGPVSCTCPSGCTEKYHALLCKCYSAECKFMNAYPPALFETLPNWNYGTYDSAALCCRCIVWPCSWCGSWALFAGTALASAALLVFSVFLCADGSSGGNCHCNSHTNSSSNTSDDCCPNCCRCGGSSYSSSSQPATAVPGEVAMQSSNAQSYVDPKELEAEPLSCLSRRKVSWGCSHLSCGFPGSCQAGDLCTRKQSYGYYMNRGETYYYSKEINLVPHSPTMKQDNRAYTKTNGKQTNLICCCSLWSCCIDEETCPCLFTDWMSPLF